VFVADLARRILLLACLLIFLLPLLSLMFSGGAPSVALAAVLALMTAARPSSGLLGLAIVVPLAFALTDAAGSSLTAVQVTESFVLAFIVGAIARSILDGRLFMDSRLARPALAIAALVAVSGLCAVFEQFADAPVAMAALWESAMSYFVSPAAAHMLQPAIHWLEFAALVPLVELSMRRRPEWRDVTLIVWLGAWAVAAGPTILQTADLDLSVIGSLLAMLVVTAIVLAVLSRRRLAAVVATLLVISVVGGLATALSWSRPTRVSPSTAIHLRVELSKIALRMTTQAPVFGVGLGRFADASRDYIDPGFVASFPGTALGQNAHNNFLQILAELGCLGLAAFIWLLSAAMRPMAVARQALAARTALIAGLATFFVCALFDHPLLIYPIAAAAFVTLGLAAGTLPPREIVSPPGLRGWAEWILVAVVLVSMPWRISAALSPDMPDVVGAGPLQPELEGVPYRVAEPQSRWRLRPRTRMAVALMRWDRSAAANCRVRIRVRNRPEDEVALRVDAWIPVRFSIPPGGRPSDAPEVEFTVSSPTCRLFVGTVTAMR
jgi:O-antigen ligase